MSAAIATASSVAAEAVAASSNDEQPKDNCFGCADDRTLWTRIWQGVAASSIALNLAAMVIEGSAVEIVAGLVACLIAPIVIYLQFQLQDTESLRMVQNKLRQEVNRLHLENNKLSAELTQLETQVGRLKVEEEKLESITREQGSNVETLVQLVKDNRETIDQLKVTVKANLAQTLVAACIDSDFDQSADFTDQEIKVLEMRMMSIPGVVVNHALLVKTVQGSDRRLESVLALLSQLDRTDLPDEERIFRLDEDRLPQPTKQ